MKTYVNMTEAAKMQGVTRATVYNWIRDNGFPTEIIGGWRMVCIEAMNEWRKARGMVPVLNDVNP